MKSSQFLEEGFVEDAHAVHQDHEVQMARADCFHAAEDALVLHKMLRSVGEDQGLEGWVAAKITLASDYLKTVREHLEYQLMSGGPDEVAGASPIDRLISPDTVLPVAEGAELKKAKRGYNQAAKDANTDKVGAGKKIDTMKKSLRQKDVAKEGVAEARVDQLPTKGADYSKYDTDHLKMMLRPGILHRNEAGFKALIRKELKKREQQSQQGVAEDDSDLTPDELAFFARAKHDPKTGLAIDRSVPGRTTVKPSNRTFKNPPPMSTRKLPSNTGRNITQPGQHGRTSPRFDSDGGITETSAGSVAGVVNPTPKNKAKVGSLFGGTYKQPKKAK